MQKVRIAQIGTSVYSHGRPIFATLAASESFEIAGYALPENEDKRYDEGILGVFQNYPRLTVDEIMQDETIDAVAIETEELYLTQYALLAAQHGKHIHMEKPGGAELCEFERLIRTVKENGKVFQIGYMYRYNPCIAALIQRVKNGELGEIVSVEAQMNGKYSDAQRQWLANLPGGIMFFLGCHMLDLIVLLQGFPKEVIPLNQSTGLSDICVTDFGMAALVYDNGVSFAKINTVEKGGFLRRQLVVTGTKGTAELKPLEVNGEGNLVSTGKRECYTDGWCDTGVYEQTPPFDRYQSMLETFALKCLGKLSESYTPDYELALYRLLLQCCGGERKE